MNDLSHALRAEHEKLLALASRLEDTTTGNPEAREDLLAKLHQQLLVQMRAKELLLYPLLQDEPRASNEVTVSRDRNRELAQQVNRLRDTPPRERQFKDDAALLSGMIRQQVEHEEEALIPVLRAVVPAAELERLGSVLVEQRASGTATVAG
jgi:DUF438 domain-containing protein